MLVERGSVQDDVDADPVRVEAVALDPVSDDAPDSAEVALPTFVVRARFAEAAATAEEAERAVRKRLTAARGLYDDVRIERREDDATWLVEARFVVASLDAHSAVLGVSETLADAGAPPDEVWADPVPIG